MNRDVNRVAEPSERQLKGVDEERHVVVRRLDDRVLRRPAIALHRRVEDTHERGIGLAHTRPFQMCERRRGERLGFARELVGVGLRVVAAQIRVAIAGDVGFEALRRRADRVEPALTSVPLVSRGGCASHRELCPRRTAPYLDGMSTSRPETSAARHRWVIVF